MPPWYKDAAQNMRETAKILPLRKVFFSAAICTIMFYNNGALCGIFTLWSNARPKKEGLPVSSHKVKLEIGGSSYVVSTNDSEEYLLGLAERLDRDMNQVMIETPNASVTAAAVITALAYLDEAEKSAFGADNMRAQIQGYLEDASRARLMAEEAKREVDRLRRELAHYEGRAAGKGQPRAAEPLLDTGAPEAPAAPGAPPAGQMGLEDL